jgi:hypothetical protein
MQDIAKYSRENHASWTQTAVHGQDFVRISCFVMLNCLKWSLCHCNIIVGLSQLSSFVDCVIVKTRLGIASARRQDGSWICKQPLQVHVSTLSVWIQMRKRDWALHYRSNALSAHNSLICSTYCA